MSGDFTARLPLPAADTPERSAGFSLSNSAVAGAPFDPQDFDVDRIPYWEAWTESVHSCRQFSTTIDGEGWDVVRYAGGRATGRLRRDTRRGEAVIVRLNEQFGFVDQLVRAHGSTFSGEVVMPAKPCWLAVRCPDGWSLTVSR